MAFYDSYGAIYQGEFSSIPLTNNISQLYSFKIFKKDYGDGPTNLTLAAEPVVQSYLNDDGKPSIKSAELRVNILNIDNQTPLSSFYSEDDDTFKIEFYYNQSGAIFTGYLLQDDCIEELTDIGHVIQLVFTDNLSVLRGVPFDQGNKISPLTALDYRSIFVYAYITKVSPEEEYLNIYLNQLTGVQVGDTMVITRTSQANGVYTVKSIVQVVANYKRVYFNEPLGTLGQGEPPCYIYIIRHSNLRNRLRLKDFIRICLHNCGYLMPVQFASSLKVYNSTATTDTFNFLDEVYLDPRTFADDSLNYNSCYEVLDKILTAFGCSLFQVNGAWLIARWNEARYFFGLFSQGYNEFLSNTPNVRNAIVPLRAYNAGKIETGMTQTLIRPLKFHKRTFNYTQFPLLPNEKLQDLGPLQNTFVQGANTCFDYEMLYWGGGTAMPLIRIVKDSFGNELERYAVAYTGAGINYNNLFEVQRGDKINYSFEFRTKNNTAGSWTVNFTVRIHEQKSILSPYDELRTDGVWSTVPASITVTGTDDLINWQTVTVETKSIPYDGFIYIELENVDFTIPGETYYRNFKFDYIPYINSDTEVKGHQHDEFQTKVIKNTEEVEIFVDDSPKNCIKGNLFLNEFINDFQQRTQFWNEGRTSGPYRLQQIITQQELFWRRKVRLKLEGTIFPIVNDIGGPVFTTMNALIQIGVFPGKYFIFGKADFNFKENRINCTLYELFEDNETDVKNVVVNPKLPPQVVIFGITDSPNMYYLYNNLFK